MCSLQLARRIMHRDYQQHALSCTHIRARARAACSSLSFTGLTLLSHRIFPPLKSPACHPSTPSSLLHTRGWKKARISATFNGRSHQAAERLSNSMVTCTGVDLEEGEVACGVGLGFMFCGAEYHVGCFECSSVTCFEIVCLACAHPPLRSTYQDLLCRDVAQWFEANDVVVVRFCYINICVATLLFCNDTHIHCDVVLFFLRFMFIGTIFLSSIANLAALPPPVLLCLGPPLNDLNLHSNSFPPRRSTATIGLGQFWPTTRTTLCLCIRRLVPTHSLASSADFSNRQQTCRRCWKHTSWPYSANFTSSACNSG